MSLFFAVGAQICFCKDLLSKHWLMKKKRLLDFYELLKTPASVVQSTHVSLGSARNKASVPKLYQYQIFTGGPKLVLHGQNTL